MPGGPGLGSGQGMGRTGPGLDAGNAMGCLFVHGDLYIRYGGLLYPGSSRPLSGRPGSGRQSDGLCPEPTVCEGLRSLGALSLFVWGLCGVVFNLFCGQCRPCPGGQGCEKGIRPRRPKTRNPVALGEGLLCVFAEFGPGLLPVDSASK